MGDLGPGPEESEPVDKNYEQIKCNFVLLES